MRGMVKRYPLFRTTGSSNPHGPGWTRSLHFGLGAGCRAVDFPWHSMSIHSPWWRRRAGVSYLPGWTLMIATNQREVHERTRKRFVVQLYRNGNRRPFYVPNWW